MNMPRHLFFSLTTGVCFGQLRFLLQALFIQFVSFFCCYGLCCHCNIGSGSESLLLSQIKFKKKTFFSEICIFHLVSCWADLLCDLHSAPLHLRITKRLFPKKLTMRLYRKNKQHLKKVSEIKYNLTEVWEWNLNHKKAKIKRVFECSCKGSVTYSKHNNFLCIIFWPWKSLFLEKNGTVKFTFGINCYEEHPVKTDLQKTFKNVTHSCRTSV